MDGPTTEMLLGIAATLATIALGWLKNTMTKKGESEAQADMILDFVQTGFSELLKVQPENAKLKEVYKQFRKLRKMWDDSRVTTEDIQGYLDELKE